MKIDEYIAALEKIKKAHGNLDVDTFYQQGGASNPALGERVAALPPSLGYRRKGPGREAFYSAALDRPEARGDAVVVI